MPRAEVSEVVTSTKKVVKVFGDFFGAKVTSDTVIAELSPDSLDWMEVIMDTERALGVDIEDSRWPELCKATTIGEFALGAMAK